MSSAYGDAIDEPCGSWSLYVPDPEGNMIELFVKTDWYVLPMPRQTRSKRTRRADPPANSTYSKANTRLTAWGLAPGIPEALDRLS